MSFAFFTSSTIAPISVVISLLVPVTPSEDTQYTKPDASFAIMLMRSWEVGAMREIRSISYFLHTESNSSFSSYGTSGRINPSMPSSDAFLMKRSVP